MSTSTGLNGSEDGFIPPVWFDGRESAAWRGFIAMRAALMARLGHELQRQSGLSEADYSVLVELSEAEGRRLRFGELGRGLGWEKSRVSRQVARMQARGLVEREDCLTDGRGAFAVLTPKGFDVIERAAPLHVEQVRRWFVEALAPEQLEAMAGIAASVVRRLGEGGAD